MAQKGSKWLALGATVPFSRLSCGYVGSSDGWTDLQNFTMDWEFEKASDGNVALTGELACSGDEEFTLGLAFGNSEHRAISNLLQSLGIPFDEHLAKYTESMESHCGTSKAFGRTLSFDQREFV